MEKNQLVTIEDKNITYVRLTYSGTYLIDGEVFEKDSPYGVKEVACKNPDDIRVISTKYIITHYENAEGLKMTINEHTNLKNKLLENTEWDDKNCEWMFDNLEQEFEYRKFERDWKPIQKCIQTTSEPIKLEKVNIKYDTGNPFITNRFFNGTDKDICLYNYDRKNAVWQIIKDVFKSIDFEYQEHIDYRQTENKKVWGGREPDYVVAFGHYVFGSSNRLYLNNTIGPLDDMLKKYEQDKTRIKNDIMKYYNSQYKDNSNFDFSSLINSLERARSYMYTLKVHKTQKNIDDYKDATRLINHSLKIINDFLTKE